MHAEAHLAAAPCRTWPRVAPLCRFYPSIARNICESVTNEVLDGKSWSGEEETVWTVQIADQVKARVKQEMAIPRYKIVVQVTLGEMRNQGIRVASKCLWDADSDNYASYSFQNVRAPPCCLAAFICSH